MNQLGNYLWLYFWFEKPSQRLLYIHAVLMVSWHYNCCCNWSGQTQHVFLCISIPSDMNVPYFLHLQTSEWARTNAVMNIMFHKMRGIPGLAENWLASKEGLCSTVSQQTSEFHIRCVVKLAVLKQHCYIMHVVYLQLYWHGVTHFARILNYCFW
jgi:hypothetical protein